MEASARSPTSAPFPSMGKGGDGVEARSGGKGAFGIDVSTAAAMPSARFEHDRHATGAIARAQRLRREMTLSEKRLWGELRKLRLHIRRQVPIGRYVADFAHHGARLVIEVDSPWHDGDAAQARDAKRDAWLVSQGYEVMRIKDGEALSAAQAVAERVAETIRDRMQPHNGPVGASADMSSNPKHRAPTPTPAPPPLRTRGFERGGD
jgi:very-short-patch-repair endonuclease